MLLKIPFNHETTTPPPNFCVIANNFFIGNYELIEFSSNKIKHGSRDYFLKWIMINYRSPSLEWGPFIHGH